MGAKDIVWEQESVGARYGECWAIESGIEKVGARARE